jgi:D-sedoheptulose 7-phosphate isomerase
MAKLVFTNGCFDIVHPGHVDFLRRAAELGDRLVVGINSDSSVRRIKGGGRPFMAEAARKAVLEGLGFVDEVIIFDDATPERLIEQLKPDVLVKGGDWDEDEIVGGAAVRDAGGEVHSLPLLEGHSSSAIVDRIRGEVVSVVSTRLEGVAPRSIQEHLEVFSKLLSQCGGDIERTGSMIAAAISEGRKLLLCGNGGSAADAQHIAAELIGRFESERIALPAIALTTDTSALTAIGNDYGFERLYARQVEGLAREGDVLVCISTSGNSPNIIAAAMKARELGCRTIALTGAGGKKLASVCDEAVLVPSLRTARIQEAHIAIGHIWCEIVDLSVREEA